MLKTILIEAICLGIVASVVTDVNLLCHSSCGTCPSNTRSLSGCSACSSTFMSYLPIPSGSSPNTCTPDPNYNAHANAELFCIIDGSFINAGTYLESFTLGTDPANINTQQQSLSSLGLYSSTNFISAFTSSNP